MEQGPKSWVSSWRTGLLLLHLPLPVWFMMEHLMTPMVAFVVAAIMFLVTLIVGLFRVGGLGIVLALSSFFAGFVGHQALRWVQISSAPWIKDIPVGEAPRYPNVRRFTFHQAQTLNRAIGTAVVRIKNRNGTTSSTLYCAIPIVDIKRKDDAITAWSVALDSPENAHAVGPRVSGTLVDAGLSDGYERAVLDAQKAWGLKSHPRAVMLSVGDPVEQLSGIVLSIPIALLGINAIWVLACITSTRVGSKEGGVGGTA